VLIIKIIIISRLIINTLLISMFQESVSVTIILSLISSILLYITGNSAVACILEINVPRKLIGEEILQPQGNNRIYEEVKFLKNEKVQFSKDVVYQNNPNMS